MRPWPALLLESYPIPEAACATRPWWHRVEGTLGWVRKPDGYRGPVQEALSTVDRMYPLPHPGFRDGQTWALAYGEGGTLATGILDFIVPRAMLLDPTYVYEPQPGEPWARFLGAVLSRGEFDFLFKGTSREGPVAYLVADPACPHLAPWAPTYRQDGEERKKS